MWNLIEVECEPGHELPQPGATLFSRSPLTGVTYRITVTSIAALAWVPGRDGVLLVSVRGSKEPVPGPTAHAERYDAQLRSAVKAGKSA